MKRLLFFLLSCLPFLSQAQGSYAERARAYILRFKDLAIAEQRRTGVPAAITLAQGIYETGAGASELATEANNHFGIKCKKEWTGATFTHTDDAPNECFRKYPSAEHSYHDHSEYLRNSPRYASLFQLSLTDYAGWATGLKRAGYATNPKYAQLLVKVVEDFNLQDHTQAALQPASSAPGEVVPEKDAPTVAVAAYAEPVTAATVPVPAAAPVVARQPAAPESGVQPGTLQYRNGLQGFYAQAGDQLLTAAMRYNVRYAKLLEWNDLTDAPLSFDQFIYLEKKPSRGRSAQHIVQEGETVHQVAQREGIQLASLRALNQLEIGEEPAAGTTLYLQGGAPIKPRTYHPQAAAPVVVAAPAAPVPATDNGYVATAAISASASGTADAAPTTAAAAAPETVASDAAPTTVAVVPPAVEVAVPATTPVAETASPDNAEAPATASAPADPLERLKARMDKAVYTPAKSAATQPESQPAPKAAQPSANSAPSPAPAARIKATTTPLPAPAPGPRTVSAALPKDMQPTTTTKAAPITTVPAGTVSFHTVGRGETVFSIAKRYGVTITDLQAWNQLDFAAIRVGQQLRVQKP